jgi:hypothetical protein
MNMNRESTGFPVPARPIVTMAGCLLLAATTAVGQAPASAAGAPQRAGEELPEPVPRLAATRTALEKWVETQRLLSQEKRDWQLGQEMLRERIALLRREIEAMRGRITEAEQSVGEADRKRAEIGAARAELQQAADVLAAAVLPLEARTRELLGRLPAPLRERLQPLAQQLPGDAAGKALPLGRRFQNVVGLLNEIAKWNREITVATEVVTLADGTSVEVATLYAGIAQGWYVSADGKAAGVGAPTDQGWRWQPANGVAAAVARAIAILKNEQTAAFVPLPIRID